MKRLISFATIIIIIVAFVFKLSSQPLILNQTFNHDTIIYPFQQVGPVWSIKLSGISLLNNDTSIVRVILTDNSGYEYLVYESFEIRDTIGGIITFLNIGEESSILDSVQPTSLKIQVIEGSLLIDTIFLTQSYIPCNDSLRTQQLLYNVSINIEKINQNLIETNRPWYAGVTNFAQLTPNPAPMYVLY